MLGARAYFPKPLRTPSHPSPDANPIMADGPMLQKEKEHMKSTRGASS